MLGTLPSTCTSTELQFTTSKAATTFSKTIPVFEHSSKIIRTSFDKRQLTNCNSVNLSFDLYNGVLASVNVHSLLDFSLVNNDLLISDLIFLKMINNYIICKDFYLTV